MKIILHIILILYQSNNKHDFMNADFSNFVTTQIK